MFKLCIRAVFLLGVVSQLQASVTYSYLGNVLSQELNLPPDVLCTKTQTCSLQGQFVVAQQLAPDLINASVSPVTYSFEVQGLPSFFFPVLDQTDSGGTFDISTDASGQISDWNISLFYDSLTINADIHSEDLGGAISDRAVAEPGGELQAYNTNDPGSWAVSTPEAGTGFLLATSLCAMGLLRLRRRSSKYRYFR